METIQHIILNFGYAGIFGLLMLGIIGLPVPDETLLAFSGYLASKGELHIALTILAAFLGSCSGITVSYFIGRVPGLALIRRYGRYLHYTDERIDQTHRWFGRVGKWMLVVGYFVPGFRHLVAIVAGSSRLRYPEFAPFAYVGALLWSTAFVCAGYFFGREWARMSVRAHHISLVVAGVLLLAGGIWRLMLYLRKRPKRPTAC